MSLSLLPEDLLLHVIQEVQKGCMYTAFLLDLRLVNHEWNGAVLHVIFVQDRFRTLAPPNASWKSVWRVFWADSTRTSCYGSRHSHISRLHLQARLDRTRAQNRKYTQNKHVLAIFRALKDASRILERHLGLPAFDGLRLRLLADYELTTISNKKVFNNMYTALICRTANKCLGSGWHTVLHNWYIGLKQPSPLESYTELDRQYEPAFSPSSITPRFWVLVTASEIGDQPFFKHCSRPKGSKQRKVIRRLFSKHYTIFVTVAARYKRIELMKDLLSCRAAYLRTPWDFFLPLRASVLAGNEELINLVMDHIPTLIKPAANMALAGVGYLSRQNTPFPTHLTDLLKRFSKAERGVPSRLETYLTLGAYKRGDLHTLKQTLAFAGSRCDAFNVGALSEAMLSTEGKLHFGHLQCLRLIVDGRLEEEKSWKGLLWRKSICSKQNRDTAILSYARSVLEGNRVDLLLPIFEKYKLAKITSIFPYLALAEGVETLMLDCIAANEYKVLREGNSYGNSAAQAALCNAVMSLRADNVRFLLEHGVRLPPSKTEFTFLWSQFKKDPGAFNKVQGELSKYHRSRLLLEL